MRLKVLATDLHIVNMRLRMPFRFGITTLTELPHLFLSVHLEVDGRRTWGVAADGLPNKWFTKDPNTRYRDDIDDMLKVIRSACDIGVAAGPHASVFELWERIYQPQIAWAGGWGYPPLLAGFGASLVERAMIDAFCRDQGVPFSTALRDDRLGLRLGRIHPELKSARPRDLLPPEPLRQITVRHTVGLTDPLTDAEISDADRVNDGLPQSLESCIRAYGLTHFKIKLWGDMAKDAQRVRTVADVITRNAGAHFAFTLDGNENFKAVEPFRAFWAALTSEPALEGFLKKLIFVEQPLHRSVALEESAMREFAAWQQRPPTIIDESDGTLTTARQALSFGYAGTSHKNCKGVFKGIANACLIEHRRRADRSRPYVISAEDLTNVGPVALQQDLCVLANLGIPHAERNGQHYFKGLTMFPVEIQDAVLAAHPDLFRRHDAGFVTTKVDRGTLQIASVIDHTFGVAAKFDPSQFMRADQWTYESLSDGRV
jgi:Enolase C-terminal domain-like